MVGRMNEFREGRETINYPELIKNNAHARAVYGVVQEDIGEYNAAPETADVLANIALDIDIIINKHCKVDWHDNPDVHKRIEQEIEDMLYIYEQKYDIKLSFKELDKLIADAKTVAIRRY